MVLGVLYLGTGTSPAATTQFCNTTPVIGVPGGPGDANPAPNASNPYPSTITVSGMTGTVSDVNAKLVQITTRPDPANEHYPEDLDVMLVAPGGANTTLMSDAGGDNTVSHPMKNVTVTLDDQAATVLPADTQITAGTYRPVNDGPEGPPPEQLPNDVYPAPAPAPSNTASLATFNGINPNGDWKLFAVDDQNLGSVDLSGGWCLTITTGGTSTSSSSSTSTSSTSSTTTTAGGNNPVLSVGDVALTEGDAKTRTASFPVTLSKASAQTVTVHYATTNASAVAPGDYTAKTGTLTLAAGKVGGTIAVPVKGDTANEGDETFTVNLSAPTNASIADGVGTGTIRNDDPSTGIHLTVGDVTLTEGSAKTQKVTFTVALSAPATSTVTVAYATANASAVAPSDYKATSGTLTFNPGVVNQKVAVTVTSDTAAEADETFTVNLSNPTGGPTVTDATGVGTIRNDD
jgi:hypothetical protein